MMDKLQEFQDRLLHWFAGHSRDLPWRRAYAPYHVWISEIMLQQTQMTRGVEGFERWIRALPDIPSVASAAEETVLKLWEGMGYYARARNIHKTAKVLVDRHGGEIPDDFAAVSALPGIGRYTAGALMSFAFNREYPAVDANVERVLARLHDLDKPVKDSSVQAFLWREAERIIPAGRARQFNQAIMELGALRCLPRAPGCPDCPVREFCLARTRGTTALRPAAAPGRKAEAVAWAAGVLVQDGLVLVRQRPPGGLMPHLWEFPGGLVASGDGRRETLVRRFREDVGLEVCPVGLLGTARHGFTKHDCTLSVFLCRPLGRAAAPSPATELRWIHPGQLSGLAMNSGQRQVADTLQRNMLFSAACRGDYPLPEGEA